MRSSTIMETPCNSPGIQVFLEVCWLLQAFYPQIPPCSSPPKCAVSRHSHTEGLTSAVDYQAAFNKLERVLVSVQVLADFSKPFQLYKDASLDSLGAVLSQVQDGKERVIPMPARACCQQKRTNKTTAFSNLSCSL